MSSLYYQHRQHEHEHEQQHQEQQQYRYPPHHSQSQAHSRHQEQRHPHHYPANYHYQDHHQQYPHHPNQEKIPTPEPGYSAPPNNNPTQSHAPANHGNGQCQSQAQHQPGLELVQQSREELLDTLAAKISQEQKNYCLETYFPPEVVLPTNGLPRQQNVIHGAWREKICQWSYNVVDHYTLPREIVSISLNYFDRYMATLSTAEDDGAANEKDPKEGSNTDATNAKTTKTGDLALLASLGTLHLATKVHLTNHNDYDPELGPPEDQHHKIPSLLSLATLSRGQFGPESIVEMEKLLLTALDWKLHPPTLFCMMNLLLELIPTLRDDPVDGIRKSIRDDLFEAAMYLAELSVCDVFFVERQISPSTIALAAICTAMDNLSFETCGASGHSMMADLDASHLQGSGCFAAHHRRRFLDTCSDRLGLGCWNAHDRTRFRQSMDRLLAIHKGAEDAGHLAQPSDANENVQVDNSPSPTNPQDEVSQRCRSNSYNPPTSPASIADMSMSTINSCIHSMAETTLGERESSCAHSTKRGDSISNSSGMPTRNESVVSSLAGTTRNESVVSSMDCYSHSHSHTHSHPTMANSNTTMSVGGRDTPDCGDDQTSSFHSSTNNFRYSPSPKSGSDGDDCDEDPRISDFRRTVEDPRISDFRRKVEASLPHSSNNTSNPHQGEIYYQPSENLLRSDFSRKVAASLSQSSNGDGNPHQDDPTRTRKRDHFGNRAATMEISPIVALR